MTNPKPLAAWLLVLWAVPCTAEIIKGPYLQDVRKDGIVVMWESDRPTRGIVLYREGSGAEGRVEEKEPVRIHELRLGGLKAETAYRYRVLSGRDESAERGFQTAVLPATPFRFVYYGDNKNGPHMHRRIALQIAAEKPHIVLQCGDLINDGSVYSQWERLFFTPAKPLIDHVPIYPSLGNHERNAEHYFRFFSLPRQESWYSFDYGSAHFVVLDSNEDRLREGSEQVAWLIQDLAGSKAKWKFVSFHHPPFTSSGNYYTEHRIRLKKLLHPIFEAHGVDIVFNGHDHNYQRSLPIVSKAGRRPVTYVVNGNGGTPLRYVGTREWTATAKRVFGYTVVDIDQARLELVGKTVEGEVIDRLTIDKSDRDEERRYLGRALAYESIADPLETVKLADEAEDLLDDAEELVDEGDDAGGAALLRTARKKALRGHELDPTCAECLALAGAASRALGEEREAIRLLEKAVALLPALPDSYEEMVEIYIDREEYRTAIEWARRWCEVEPDQTDAEEALAEIYIEQGKSAEALAALLRALVIVPSDDGVHRDLAELYEGLGLKEEAVRHYREAMRWSDEEDAARQEKLGAKIRALRD